MAPSSCPKDCEKDKGPPSREEPPEPQPIPRLPVLVLPRPPLQRRNALGEQPFLASGDLEKPRSKAAVKASVLRGQVRTEAACRATLLHCTTANVGTASAGCPHPPPWLLGFRQPHICDSLVPLFFAHETALIAGLPVPGRVPGVNPTTDVSIN
ncbi:hypothetical protein CB1_000363003 [Camelus ferus]|nr:hypothetical protein CB1_000363003 [Camelus ferus]